MRHQHPYLPYSTGGQARACAWSVPLSYSHQMKTIDKALLLTRLLSGFLGILAYSIVSSSCEAEGHIIPILQKEVILKGVKWQ